MVKRTRIFSRQEICLLKDSKTIQDYPVLKDLLLRRPDLQRKEVPALNDEEKRLILLYPNIYSTAANEWRRADEHLYPRIEVSQSDEHKKCELCGNTQCDVLYPIVNHDQSVLLYVGSDCVKNFMKESGHSIVEEEKERRELKKYVHLETVFPGIYGQFLSPAARHAAEDRDYLVVDPLHSKCRDAFNAVRSLCKRCTNAEGQDVEALRQEIADAKARYESVCREIDEYLSRAGGDPRIPDRKTVNQLLLRKRKTVVNKIVKDGGISKKTLPFIDESDFLKKHYLPVIQSITNQFPVRITDVDEHLGSVGYRARLRDANIFVHISHAALAQEFGKQIMERTKTAREKTLLSLCRVTDETDTVALLRGVIRPLNRQGLTPLAVHEDTETLFFRYDQEHYCRVPLQETLNGDMPFLIAPDKYGPEALLTAVREKDAQITPEEWREFAKDEKRRLRYV